MDNWSCVRVRAWDAGQVQESASVPEAPAAQKAPWHIDLRESRDSEFSEAWLESKYPRGFRLFSRSMRGAIFHFCRRCGIQHDRIPQLKRNEPATSFKVRGRKLKVDLLVPARGKPYETVAVREWGAHATGLPHLKFLIEEPTQSVLLGRERIVPVTVPHVGRFCVHKLALSSLRGGSNPKSQKDVFQAAFLAAAMSQNQDYLLRDAIAAMDKGLRAKAKAGARRAIELLNDKHPDAADQLTALA